MHQNKNLNKIITESSVIITSLLIFFGFLKQYWYYSTFNIKIQNYLAIDEVIIIFLGELPFILKLILWALLYLLAFRCTLKIIFYYKDKKNNNIESNSEEDFNTRFEEGLEDKRKLNILLGISIFTTIVCALIFIKTLSEIALIYFILQISQGIYALLKLIDIEIEKNLRNIIIFFFCMSIMLYCKNMIDINNTLNSKENIRYLSKDSSNSHLKYILIGKTKEFLFLYNKTNNTTRIVKAENFIELEFNID